MKTKFFYLAILFTLLSINTAYAAEGDLLKSLIKSINTLDTQQTKQKVSPQNDINTQPNLITAIEISGNKIVPTDYILGEINLKIGDKLNEYKLYREIKNIQSLGIFAAVDSKIINENTGKKIIIKVQENPIISKIEFAGVSAFKPDELLPLLRSKKGELLNLDNIRSDISKIDALYSSKGYFQAKTIGIAAPKKEGDPLTFNVNEGILSAIVITGNTRTQDYVILREMDLAPGSILQTDLLRKDLQKIFNLNYFGELIPSFKDSTADSGKILEIAVTEKSTGSVNFGGGYSQTQSFFGYSDLYIDNLLGTGQLVSLRGQIGQNNNTYEFKYHNPWMWDKRKGLTLRLWHRDGEFIGVYDNSSTNYDDQKRTGSDVSISWPLTYELKTNHTFKVENIDPEGSSPYKIQSYRFSIAYDTRDVWFNPSQGLYYSFSVEKGFDFNTAPESLDFEKYDLGFRNFFPTFENQVIATRLEFGYRHGDSEGSEMYYVGGANSVRGYLDTDTTNNPHGNKRVLASLEYRFLFNDTFQGVLFLDAGYATNNSGLFDTNSILDLSSYKIGKGIGIRVTTPLGPMRLDWGFPDVGDNRIHFSIGHAF